MAHYLFLHSGPGLNSFGEEALLSPLFEAKGHVLHCWNEPSRLRPTGDAYLPEAPFSNWVASARKAFVALAERHSTVGLIGHSFATQAILRLVPEAPQAVSRVTLITPCIRPHSIFKAIMQLAQKDFARTNPDSSRKLETLLAETRRFFDPAMKAGLELAFSDPELLGHYWVNPKNLEAVFAAWAARGGQPDPESLFGVLAAFAEEKPDTKSYSRIETPTRVVFGAADPLVDRNEQLQALNAIFTRLQAIDFERSSHNPHIEEAARFVEVVTGP